MTLMTERKTWSGVFDIGAASIPGDLTLDGGQTNLLLHQQAAFNPTANTDSAILGILSDRTKASLLQCNAPPIPTRTVLGQEVFHTADVFSHYVLLGRHHLRPLDAVVSAIEVVTDDMPTLFYDFDAFGFALRPADSIASVVAENEVAIGRPIAVGDKPEIAFYTGRAEICAAETVIGRVSAQHNPRSNLGGPSGVFIENEVSLAITFPAPKRFTEAIEDLLTLLGFLLIIAGRQQNLTSLKVHTRASPSPLHVHWSLPPRRDIDAGKGPHVAELPIQAAQEPAEFSKVLAQWVSRQPDWREARARFAAAFSQGRSYNVDRLVAAANMFDLLPAAAAPARVPISDQLRAVKATLKAEIKTLPPGPERESLFNAVGRIGHASLRQKIGHRAQLISMAFPEAFPGLLSVVGYAVDCRNHFVHGGKPKIDYSGDDFAIIPFLTETLEFIFAVSDLLDAGWEPSGWRARGSTLSHPLGAYASNYRLNHAAFSGLL
jgi:hypothetical protein